MGCNDASEQARGRTAELGMATNTVAGGDLPNPSAGRRGVTNRQRLPARARGKEPLQLIPRRGRIGLQADRRLGLRNRCVRSPLK